MCSIYHIKVESFKEQEIEVTCPFCGTSEKINVGADDE